MRANDSRTVYAAPDLGVTTTLASTLPASLSSFTHLLTAGFHLKPTRKSLALLSAVSGASVARHVGRRATGTALAAFGVERVLISETWHENTEERQVPGIETRKQLYQRRRQRPMHMCFVFPEALELPPTMPGPESIFEKNLIFSTPGVQVLASPHAPG